MSVCPVSVASLGLESSVDGSVGLGDPLVAEALAGLRAERKTLPCKLLYDAAGSAWFDRITELPEYYPTRTEDGIMGLWSGEMAGAAVREPGSARLVELGSGSSVKTRRLLDALPGLAAYLPVDISEAHLLKTARGLRGDYPGLAVLPVVADYDRPIPLPERGRGVERTVLYFPGSTIGNFEPDAARVFLRRLSRLGEGLLIGIDLVKPVSELLPAYDDAAGVTAAFNLNLLHRLNREAGADFEVSAFRHAARWDAAASRVEMHLVSERDQVVTVCGEVIAFEEGETIWTESSHKYTPDGFAALAEGWCLRRTWTDDAGRFAVCYLERG